MSEDNKNIDMKSCSESNVFNDSMSVNNVKQAESDKPKLRRTFTLPRNPFGSVRVSNRRPKTSENQQSPPSDESIETSETENEKPGIKIFRRPSWRRFINKIAQRMNAVGVPGVKLPQPDSRVPPVGGFPWPPDQTPGVTGLRNHGNTCFMNAVLQCLSHTDILAEYFVLDQYKVDLSRRNKLNSRKFGTRGELTEQLALVLKALWACRDSPELSTGFKAVVERHGSQFRGSAQHDAQEFLNWLLERVHEDLNTATKRRYKSIKNTLGRPDEVVAAETLANYVRCHSSFVQAVFQAQFRSSLTCPRCLKQSNTFDPFHCIAVQLPQVSVQNVIITVLYSSQQPRQMRLGLTVSPETNIGTLRELLQSDTGIPAHRIVLTEIGEQGFTRTFCDSQPMSVLCEGDPVFCIEAPPLECSGDESSAEKRQAEDGELKNVPTIDGGPYLLLCWVNVLVKENAEIEKFGSPYAMQVPRDTGYGDLQKLILKDMAPMLHDNVLEGAQPLGVFRARLAEPLADPDGSQYVDTDVEHPLFTETFDTCLTLYPPDAGPPHIKLILEWGPKEYEELIQHSKDVIEDHSSVSQLQSKPLHCAPLTLEQCLEHYTKAETLADDNAWRCPHCQQYLPAVKTLGLWSLPDILVIHFVRFRQQQLKGPKSTKLTTMVDFPLQGFDMTPHLSRPYPPSDDVSLKAPVAPLLGGVGWSPWKRPRKSNQCNDNLYDLYAVCYHQGDDLETGHYTAACKNPFDSLWYKFDDTKVTMIDNDVQGALVNNGAYILFYQKQQGGSGGSSAASSTSGDHWAARMAPFPKPSSEITVTTKPNTVAPTTTVTKSESFAEEREPYSETNIRNSMSLSDNLMVDIGIDTDSKENINNERENNKNVKINEVITDLMKSKIDVNEYRRNTFDGTMNKDIHINPKMRSTTNLNRSSLTSIKSDSKINLITNVKVADLLLKSKTVADKNTSHVECPEKIVENCVSVSRVRKVDVQSGHVSQSGTNVTRALGRYATLGPEQTLRNTMDYRDHHSDDEALPARNDWMSPLSMRRAVVPP